MSLFYKLFQNASINLKYTHLLPRNIWLYSFGFVKAPSTDPNIQGVFFNWHPPENVSRLASPKMPGLAPPKSFKYENHIEVLRHLRLFSIMGGASLGL